MTLSPPIPIAPVGNAVRPIPLTETADSSGKDVRQVLERLGIQYIPNETFSYYGRPITVSFFLPQLNIAVQRWSATGDTEAALASLEKEVYYGDLKFRRIGRFFRKMWYVGVVTSDLDESMVRSYVVPLARRMDHLNLGVIEFEQYLKTLTGRTTVNVFPMVRLDLGGKSVFVPARVESHESFVEAVSKIREALTGETLSTDTPESLHFIGMMYYLLGWIVGDAGKTFTSERLLSARLAVELTKAHPENIPLGEYVGKCVKELGISWIRRRDKKPTTTDPSGAFRWQSLHSSAVGWFHTACLGLGWTERTTRTAVKMEWLLTAPPEFRIQFLRGLADSDGMVHFKDKAVTIITQPNTHLVAALFQSLGIHARLGTTHGCGMVTISGTAAAEIKIFNPEVMTHRRKILERLTNARTFQRHWPRWLEAKVEALLSQNFGIRNICETLLEEDNAYVKYNTLKRKRQRMI